MRIKRKSISRNIEILYWILTFLIFAFVANNDKKFIGELLVFYVPGTKWLIHLLFLAPYVFVYFFLLQKVHIDGIEVLLFLKFLCDIFSTCILNEPESFAFIIWADIGVVSYLVCRNAKLGLQTVLNLYELFALLLSVQSIHAGLLLLRNGITFDNYLFKSFFRIPFAGSNLISGVVSSAIISTLARYDEKESRKIFYTIKLIVYLSAVIVIRSRASIVLLLFVLDWTFIKRIGKVRNGIKRFNLYAILTIMNIAVIVYALNSPSIGAYFSRYINTASDITSGRIKIWQYAWKEFLNKPMLGRGISFEPIGFVNYTGAHNIWLEIMMSSGIIGFLLHFGTVFIVFSKIRLYLTQAKEFSKQIFACAIVVSFLYINSLVEVSYYNYFSDTIFWSLCGCLISEINKQVLYSSSMGQESITS